MGRLCLLRYKSEPIIDSLAECFKILGHEVKTLVVDGRAETEDEILSVLRSFSPDVCLTHNFYVFDSFYPSRRLEEFFVDRKLPCLLWYFDSPFASGHAATTNRYLFGHLPDCFLTVVADSGHLPDLRSRKLKSEFLPVGVADTSFEVLRNLPSELCSKFSSDLSFVGQPLRAMPPEPLKDPADIKSFYERHSLREIRSGISEGKNQEQRKAREEMLRLFETELSKFFSSLYCRVETYEAARLSVLNSVRARFGERGAQSFQAFFGVIDFSYSWCQLNLYLTQLQDFGISVYGSERWPQLLPGYSKPSPRLSDLELLACFQNSKISFCHTKWHFKNVVHERVFLVYASGGFPITDFRSDLYRLFKRDEIVAYEGIEHAKDLIRFYLKHPAERERISAKGKKRVESEHRYSHRAHALCEMLRNHFGFH
jgi:hypothetical protein